MQNTGGLRKIIIIIVLNLLIDLVHYFQAFCIVILQVQHSAPSWYMTRKYKDKQVQKCDNRNVRSSSLYAFAISSVELFGDGR